MVYLLALLGLVGAGLAHAQPKSDWERAQESREFDEGEVVTPPFPKEDTLIEFVPSINNPFRFYIDGATLTTSAQGVVRFVLVAVSPSGVRSVSFEGIRCATGESRVYAYGRNDNNTWSNARNSRWREIEPRQVARQTKSLQREFFCPRGIPIRSREEGINALRRGIHPDADAPRN